MSSGKASLELSGRGMFSSIVGTNGDVIAPVYSTWEFFVKNFFTRGRDLVTGGVHPISCLFFRCSPSTVFREVPFGSVNAVYGFTLGPRAHV